MAGQRRLTDILWVERGDDQQEGPRLPVEGGDGEVRRLVPGTQGADGSASGHEVPTGTGPGQGGNRLTDPNVSTGASVTPLWDLRPQDAHGCTQHTARAHTPAPGSGTRAPLPSALASHPIAREHGKGNKHSIMLTTVVILCIKKPENTPVSIDV